MMLNSATILGVSITSTSTSSVLGKILDFEAGLCPDDEKQGMGKQLVIFTPNPEFLVEASQNPQFKDILNQSDVNLPDGFGLLLAAKVLGVPVKERISGADLVEKLMQEGNKREWTVGIVNARHGVVDEVKELVRKLSTKYPNLKIIDLDNPQFQISNSRLPGFARQSGQVKFQIVLACHGMVKQEKWIMENKDKINSKVFMGVGGSLDFLTGFTKRAPRYMRVIGLEWLWRGLQRPKHFKRIWKAVVVFPWLVVREKFSNYKL